MGGGGEGSRVISSLESIVRYACIEIGKVPIFTLITLSHRCVIASSLCEGPSKIFSYL